MIHKIVQDAFKCMENYEIPQQEKFEMIYCLGRIDSAYGHHEAMVDLNAHLDRHYELKPNIEEKVKK